MYKINNSLSKFGILLIGLLFSWLPTMADEGMWLPLYLKSYNFARMKELGLQLPAEEVFSNQNGSLKDAIVWFNGGCTAEVISDKGLLLTNHHCGFSEIASHSTLQNNYLQDGFWAQDFKAELPCKGLTVSFVREMHNVTAELLQDINPYQLTNEAKAQIKSRLATISAKYKGPFASNPGVDVMVTPMFYGTEYYLFVLETFTDVRLVGAPPSGIGKFGGDTDNWMWPRHTGDFSMFRIYSNQNNQPAEYNPNNTPYTPRKSLTISLQGVKPGDFTMVYGFPGRTQEYISSYQLELVTQVQNKHKIALRKKRLEVIDAAMASGPKLRLMYADAQASIANYWKKWLGENNGVERAHTLSNKQEREAKVEAWLNANKTSEIPLSFADLKRWTDSLRTVALANDYYREAVLGNGLLAFAATWEDALKTFRTNGNKPDVVAGRLKSLKTQIEEFYATRNQEVEVKLLAICLKAIHEDVPERWHPKEYKDLIKKHKGDFNLIASDLYKKSYLASAATAEKGLQQLLKMDTNKVSKDPAILLYRVFTNQHKNEVQPRYQLFMSKLEGATGLLLGATRKMDPDKKLYPDANSTLRVAFGKVDGFQPTDGVFYKHYTTLDGVMEKQNDSIEEFKVPLKLKLLWKNKDYGSYAVNGTVPLAFTASNHTTGGNSGSPVLDAKGRLIGTNFDRCWEGTMSDLQYDKDRCRNIALDVRYTLFIIDKYGECRRLIDEMKIER